MRIRYSIKRYFIPLGLLGQMVIGCSATTAEEVLVSTTTVDKTTTMETATSTSSFTTIETGVYATETATTLTDSGTVTSETGGVTTVGDGFADVVISFEPGEGAGFGAENMPDVVLGPPRGGGALTGSMDVVSLGNRGVVVLELLDVGLIDGPGIDLLVFENPFPGWVELGEVAVSENGVDWHTFPCNTVDADQGHPGCAGVLPVLSHPDNGIDPTDPSVAGGDAFDLADIGVKRARFVRITDTGTNTYDGSSGGFDLDAIAVANGEWID